jgi:hypothetical protein
MAVQQRQLLQVEMVDGAPAATLPVHLETMEAGVRAVIPVDGVPAAE